MATVEERKLDPLTFEVLKNAFINLVDQMAEQILRTCYSFVIYARDFSSCLNDAEGNTVMQGSQDISVHVGTLHYTAKAALKEFEGDLHPGDVIIVNDPYVGGTHFNDTRILRPVFYEGELIALTNSNGHWADVGGRTPGSFDITAKEHFGEGMRFTPTKIWDKGQFRRDVAKMIASNMRAPEERLGDLRAQTEATRVGEQYLLRLIKKYGKDTVLAAFQECQTYAERIMKAKIKSLPKGVWETDDYLDMDPDKEEGLARIHIALHIREDELFYDLTGTDSYVGCFLNNSFGSAFSAVVAGTKTFFPDVPLNSGVYRVVKANLPEGTIVNAPWPIATTGYCSGGFEKIMNGIFDIWSRVMRERALACSFNLEYLLVGGWDRRPGYSRQFMWYDWMMGGWGGRNGKDGSNCTAPVFGVGLSVQPLEAQERLCPVITTAHEIITDSGGPGKWRGGCGVEKGGILTKQERTVMGYCCDRERSITWGINGGLPAYPHGVWLNPGTTREQYLGAIFSNIPIKEGDLLTRPSSGGGGFGDPLERDPKLVLEDVIDGYVSIERARKDYGVVISPINPRLDRYEIDFYATQKERAAIRQNRLAWLETDPDEVRGKLQKGEIDFLDTIRRYGVIIDRKTGQVLYRTTQQFRDMFKRRSAQYWK